MLTMQLQSSGGESALLPTFHGQWVFDEERDHAILAKAFRGELVPQDPNDEPASVLLERIRVERATAPVKVKARGSKHFVRQRQPKRSAKSIPS